MKHVFTMAVFLMICAGCKKSKPVDNDTNSSRDNAYAEATFDDAEIIAQEAGSTESVTQYRNNGTTRILINCAIVTFQNKNPADQDTILINFTNGCGSPDGRIRGGEVIVYYTSPYKSPGHTHTITFNNYLINGNRVSGTAIVTNNGLNGQNNMNWSLNVKGSIAITGGGTITWSSSRTSELISGWNSSDSTINWSQAKWSLTGQENGVSATGIGYSAVTGSALIRDFSCTLATRRYYTQGVLNLTPTGKVNRTVNWGNGTCGSSPIVDISGTSYEIVLR